MEFEVVVDSSLIELISPRSIHFAENKAVVVLINDFEDGNWRAEKFNNFIWDNIAETALTKRERETLQCRPSTLIRECAKNLRLTDGDDDISRGSELAEIALYGILRHKFKALSAVPKIFYKQNAQDNAKGADSVHIVIESENDFSLWFGEAKFYKSISDARLGAIVESVRNALSTDKLKKENSIVLNISELDEMEISSELKSKIRLSLSSRASIDDIKPKIVVPILLLHECEMTANCGIADKVYKENLRSYHADRAFSYFSRQVEALKEISLYGKIRFYLILFPVPNKQCIVDSFVDAVKFHKG